uniref:GB1/RHD3-type G domain-containing protein n=1 Tax=Hanusia phi TaxID=3032 RepID=A0A7S0ES13_9CRYP|mmetsp:Transcript_29939/g.67719  ORF Transcript_29939/g.67719 Transcript_29939/m.67719 type:complete len:1560 (+) Transcript_29939:35-4714(+)
MPSDGKAIPFIALQDGKFNVTEEAAEFLKSIEYPVSVIAVVGLYRTGKSFLLNRILLEQSDGFQVGPTVNPCTKGLWLWNRVMKAQDKDGNTVNYLIIDTEGIGALDTNSQHDSIIFSLALLLSSYFVYNSVGSIDEGALNNLSLVVNLTKHIHVRSSAQGGEDDGADFAQYFPAFMWLVRDFTLQLVNHDGQPFSAKEYLERALQPVPGFTEQIEAKNRIRRMLTHFFPDRDCFTMVRPVTDENLLQRLSQTPSDQLRPEFLEQMFSLRKTIVSCAKPKKMNGTELDGVALVNLAYAYTMSINTGSVPSIQNAWSYICESKCQQALNDAISSYEKQSKEMIQNELPLSIEDLEHKHRAMEKQSWALFQKHAIGSDTENFKHQLEDKIRELHRLLQNENSARGRDRAKEILEKLYKDVDTKVQSDGYSAFEDFESERKSVRSKYLEEVPNGPAKQEVLSSFMEQKLAEVGLRFGSKSEREIQKVKADSKAEVDEMAKELSALKMESENNLKNLKLKLEFAEKYNEDAKSREKENKEEMQRLRSTHEEAMKELRAKAEAELKAQVNALEEKRQKAQLEAQQFEQQLLQFKKDQEMQTALLEQEKEFAKRNAAESQSREADLRRLLENAKKDAESEVKALQERFEMEKKQASSSLQQLTEQLDRATEEAQEWKTKHAALGVQLSEMLKKLSLELEENKALCSELKQQKEDLEKIGGQKAKAENEQLAREIEALKSKIDDLAHDKTNLSNQVLVSQEEKQRLEGQLQQIKRDCKEYDEKNKALSVELDQLQRSLATTEEKDRNKEKQLEEMGKQLTQISQDKQAREQELLSQLQHKTDELEGLKKGFDDKSSSLDHIRNELNNQIAELNERNLQQADEIENLTKELEAVRGGTEQDIQEKEARWKQTQKEMEDKHKRKIEEINAASERSQLEIKNGFETEKEVLNLRIKSLENQVKDAMEERDQKQIELDETLKEYETAMDELEQQLKAEMDEKEKELTAKFNELEKNYYKMEADLTKTNEGLSSRNDVIEKQLVELKASYKEEKEYLEARHAKEMKEYRTDVEAKMKQLEQDLSATLAKNEMLKDDMAKAQEKHTAQISELSSKYAAYQDKAETERKELQRLNDERQKELQIELEDMKNEVKRLENEKIMTTKDHETERALLKSHIDNLEKQLKERETVLRELEQTKEAELSEARVKIQNIKTEDEARMTKERDEAKARYEDLRVKSEEKIRNLKEEINAKLTENKVLNERIESFKANEQRINSALQENKTRLHEEKENLSSQIKGLKEQLQQTQKELSDEKGEHQMTRLRSEKQEEWDRRELAQLKEELLEKKKVIETMISKDIYKRDMDTQKSQHQSALAEVQRDRETERAKFDADKKKLEEELVKCKTDLKKAFSEGVMTDQKQKEFTKLSSDKERLSKEMEACKADLDTLRKMLKVKDDELKKKEQDFNSHKEQMKPVMSERDELKRERDDLETKVMKLDMELRNIQQIEERKYQVEIMRLKTEVEELKRADKKKQQIEPKAPMSEQDASMVAQPALTSALARVRARRSTAQGQVTK